MTVALRGIDTREELARALRQLRRREARCRGGPELTYRELATKTGWSVGIIGGYLTGKVLPPTDRFDVLVMMLGATPAERGALATARDRIAERRHVPAAPAAPAPADPAPGPPNLLPADVPGFAGRAAHLRELDLLLTGYGDSARMATVSGTAGVGKTALAVHWAHRAAARFPDGQLYADLRGFDSGGTPLKPADAIRGFLAALDVPAHRVPAGPDEQAALYRSLLARRRVLLVLDNARDAAQVRPLLPGSASAVVVTSRTQLTGLVATENARPVALGLLTGAEARELLIRRLGPERVAAEPEAVDEIIALCARLPLALAIAAARAATRRGLPLATLAAELAAAGRRLDVLDTGDAVADVRAVFSWSYRALPAGTARLFRFLGLHPGPDTGPGLAASLAGVPVPEARVRLAELARAHLVTEHVPGRYAVHDLLHAYAVELTRTHDGPDDRHAAVHRMLDHCVRTAQAANTRLDPVHDTGPVRPPVPGVACVPMDDHQEALSWFTAEYRVLLCAVPLAAESGLDEHACHLAWLLGTFCNLRGYWTDRAAVQRAVLPAAYRLADRCWRARLHGELAYAYACLGGFADSQVHFRHALDGYAELGDDIGLARTHRGMCLMYERQGRFHEALAHARRSRDLLLDTGDDAGKAYAFNSVGWYHALVGDFHEALDNCRQAITLLREVGDRLGEATTWDSLGYAHHHLGQYREALGCYQQALDTFRDLGDRYYEADTLHHLGDSHQELGDRDAAREAWRQARVLFEELGRSEADELRAKLGG
jgi:tetratricopeptide (TPR) repeat protein